MTPDEMRAGLLKAFELLTFGSPDRELHNKAGITKWVDDCDAWLDKFAPSRVRLPDEPTADWPMLLKSCPDTEFMAFFEDNPDMAYVVSASAKLQPGHWICQNADCKGHNFPDDLVCIHCGADPKNFPSVQNQLRDDLLIYGTSFARRNADGTIERIDPRDVRFEVRPCEHNRGPADICTKCGILMIPVNRRG